MAVGITPLEGFGSQRRSAAWPLLVEAALVVAVIVLLLPLFAPLSAQDAGRNGRFAARAVTVQGLPALGLPELCAAYGGLADPAVRERACGGAAPSSVAARLDRAPPTLVDAVSRLQQALLAPLEEARARVARLRQQQREGAADDLALNQAIDDAIAEIAPALRPHALARDPVEARALGCGPELLRAVFGGAVGPGGADREAMRANVVLLLGAALDAHAAMPGAIDLATLPEARMKAPRCAGLGAREIIAGAAILMADARRVPVNAAKDEAMRTLLHTAGWQWAAWAILGLALLNVQRLRVSALVGVSVALAAWAAMAWAGRVPSPFSSAHAFVFARPSIAMTITAPPAAFVLWMLATAAILLAVAPWLRGKAADAPSAPASVLAYPGLVAATGIGWLLLLDLSANGHFGNRYLALYHQGHLWLGMLTFSIVAFLRQPIGRGLGWALSLVDGVAARIERRLGVAGTAALFVPAAFLLTAAIASMLANMRQLTSELGRLWLIVGAAWFFFMRGTPLTERVARTGSTLSSLARYTWPLLFVVVVLVSAMTLTRDMGPLLIAGYGAGAFVAASVAMWLYQRSGATATAYAIAVLIFAAWIAATTLALFKLGSIDQVTAERLENAGAPLLSVSDQMALVTWFQRAAPPAGFGPGAVPWCGFAASTTCAGVPAQIQSDYTFTALVGMFGWTAAWALTLACALWLYEAVRPHGRATRGEPRFVRVGGRLRNDEQAFLSWLSLAWLIMTLCQLAVTVAGNLTILPLTGVTFPFVSFGMTSLVLNMAMLALAANVDVAST